MILLTSTSDLIQVITGGTQVVNCHASFVDMNGGTVTPGRTNTSINSAATTTVVASPASSTQRTVKTLVVRNTDASASDSVTIQHTDGTTPVKLIVVTLLAGYSLTYDEGTGWGMVDASGGRVLTPLSGRWLKTSILTSSSGTFTSGPATNSIRIRGVGGGAGGAGCTSVASAASAGGGGGAGGYLEKTVAVTPNTGYSYTCGALGAGASGALGGNGGASTFIVGATTYTANGGTGAPVATALTTLVAYPGGAGGVVSTNGDVNSGGEPGQYGVTLIVATPIVSSGRGGSSQFGSGGNGITAVGNGNNALGYGAGGSGAATGASAVRTGGSGTAGCWVVDEYS